MPSLQEKLASAWAGKTEGEIPPFAECHPAQGHPSPQRLRTIPSGAVSQSQSGKGFLPTAHVKWGQARRGQ